MLINETPSQRFKFQDSFDSESDEWGLEEEEDEWGLNN